MQEKLEHVNCDLCNSNETTLLFTKDDYKHVKCNSCGLIYVNPRLRHSKDNLDNFYASDEDPEGLIKSLLHRAYSARRQKIFCAELKKMERYRKLDRILDIGCSFGGFLYTGTGVIGRRTDIRWRRREEDVESMVTIQKAIITHMAQFLKPGGIMV